MSKNYNEELTVNVNGQDITVWRIDNDVNGNPRYVVHFPSLGIKLGDYGYIPNLTKYRAKWFGGGYVFQSHHVESDLKYMIENVKKYYDSKKPDYASDLHKKGELKKVAKMEKLAKELVGKKDMGTAFLTNGFLGYDCVALIANKPSFTDWEGYIVYDNNQKKALFVYELEGGI